MSEQSVGISRADGSGGVDASPQRVDPQRAPSDGAARRDALRAWRAMRALVLDNERRREVCDALGLSFLKIRALRCVAVAPVTLRELAVQLTTDPPYATVVVHDLEERGLVERVAHPEDRRAKLVRATPDGEALAARAQAILEEPPAVIAALGADDIALVARLLDALVSRRDSPHAGAGSPP